MTEITVVIPCYNVEKYLKRSLDSVLNQSFKDIEIICVNDGSYDNSLDILRQYSIKDERIKIINQTNKGAGSARNTGIKHASGKYLMFLDADDYFEPYALQEAYNAIKENKTDVVIFGFDNLLNGKRIKSYSAVQIHKYFNKTSNIDNSIHFSIFQKIYDIDFIRKHNIKIPEGLVSGEDVVFHYLIIYNGAAFSYLDKILLVYQNERPDSITTNNINLIKHDLLAAKTLSNMDIYKIQPFELRKLPAIQWLNATIYNYQRFNGKIQSIKLRKDMIEVKNYIETLFTKDELKEIKEYDYLNKTIKSVYFNCLKSLFNITPKRYSEDYDEYLKEINFNHYFNKLKKKVKNKKVILYAAGMFLEHLKESYDFSDLDILAISDKNFNENTNEKIFGYKAIPVSEIKKHNPNCIIVCAMKYENIIKDFKKNKDLKKFKIYPLAKKPLL